MAVQFFIVVAKILPYVQGNHKIISGKALDYEKVKVAVEKSTTTYCSVIAMLSKTANINVTFRIVED